MSKMDTHKLIQRVPIFHHFTEEQAQKVLEITLSQSYEQEQVIFVEGDESTDMLIVLDGTLQIQSGAGSEIATVRTLGIVGEMGALTNQPRSATVVAQSNTNALSIPTDALQKLIETDADMGFKIYRNVTHILCDHLRDNNMLIEQQLFMLEDLTGDDLNT